ncbi:MAG: hypothetical protein ACOVO1_11110, partial [Chitinophagaceae bacterium]
NITTASTYNVLAASLSIISATNTSFTGNVGSTYTQQLTIRNGGLGCTNTAFIKLDRAGGTFSFSNPSVGTISNDTLFLNNADMPGGDGKWCNSEDVTVSYDVTVNNCTNLNRAAQAGWGCGGSSCQVSTATNSNVIISNSVPTLVSSIVNPHYNYCFAGENVKQTVRITNNGTGPATNIKVRHHNFFPGSFRTRNYFDTTVTWELRNSSGVVIGTVNRFSPIGASINVQIAGCATVSRLEEVEGNIGVTLAPGDFIEYDVWLTAENMSCLACNRTDGPNIGFRTNLFYQNQCATNNYTTGYTNTIGRANFMIDPVLTGPVDITGNVPFNLNVEIPVYLGNNHPNNIGSIYMAIPTAGTGISTSATSVSFTNGGSTTSLPVFTRNDTIFIKFPNNLSTSGRSFNLPLIISCGSGGAKTINSMFLSKYDSTCSPTQVMSCETFTTNLHCSEPCPKGGATPQSFVLKRINYGLADNDNNGVPDASGSINLNLIKDHNSVNGDTLMGIWNIKVFPNVEPTDPNVGLNFNHLYVDFNLGGTTAGAAGTLNALPSAQATVYPAGGGASFTCTVTPVV